MLHVRGSDLPGIVGPHVSAAVRMRFSDFAQNPPWYPPYRRDSFGMPSVREGPLQPQRVQQAKRAVHLDQEIDVGTGQRRPDGRIEDFESPGLAYLQAFLEELLVSPLNHPFDLVRLQFNEILDLLPFCVGIDIAQDRGADDRNGVQTVADFLEIPFPCVDKTRIGQFERACDAGAAQ